MSILGPLADVIRVEHLMIAAGSAMVVVALIALLLPSGRRAIEAAHASSSPGDLA
jgi:DHA3 family macrolide efflux protein-like MFS transporter